MRCISSPSRGWVWISSCCCWVGCRISFSVRRVIIPQRRTVIPTQGLSEERRSGVLMSIGTCSWRKLKGLHSDSVNDAVYSVGEVLSEMEAIVKYARDSIIVSSSGSGNTEYVNIKQENATSQIFVRCICCFKQYVNHLLRYLNNQLGKCWKDCASISNNCLEKATRTSRDLFCSVYIIRQRFKEFLVLLSQMPGNQGEEGSSGAKYDSSSRDTRRSWENTLRNELMKMICNYLNLTISTSVLRVASALKSCFKMHISKVKQYNDFHECWSNQDTQQLMNMKQKDIQKESQYKECNELLHRILVSCFVSAYLESSLFDKINQLQSGDQDKENISIDEHVVNYDMLSILGVLTNNDKISIIETILIDKRPIFKADLILKAIVTDMSQFSSIEQSMMKSLLSFEVRKKLTKEKNRREKSSGGRCLPKGFLGLGNEGNIKTGKVEVALPSYTLPLDSSRSLEVDIVEGDESGIGSEQNQLDNKGVLNKPRGDRESRRTF